MNQRLLAGFLAVMVLGAMSPSTDAVTAASPEAVLAAQNVPTKAFDSRAEIRLINQKMRELGFSFSRIERVEGGYIVHVVGFRPRTNALEQRGEFRPFAVRAQVTDGQVVLDKDDIERAGIIIIDMRPLADRGIRIEAIKDIAKVPGQPGRPVPDDVKLGPAAADRPFDQSAAQALKRGRLRWTPLSITPPAPDRSVQPPAIGQAVAIQKPEMAISFDQSTLRVNRRPQLKFIRLETLDPTKETPTPIAPSDVLPAFDSGESLTAGEYYRDLNALEQEFNALGYSLDFERDPAEEILLQEVPQPPLQNGVGIRMDWKPREGIQLRADNFRRSVGSKQDRLAAIKTAVAPTPEAKTMESAMIQRPSDALIKGTVVEKLPTPRPFREVLAPPAIERGSRSTFAITLQSGGNLAGDPDKLEVTNTASASAYIFNNPVRLINVTGTTKAPVRKDALTVRLGVMILGDHIAAAAFDASVPVPNVALSEMGTLPTAGKADAWTRSIDVSYGFSFMVGPIPVSVRIGTRAAVGVEYALLASPIRVENEVTPFANADVYAQAGIDLLIVEGGVECGLRLLDGRLTVHGMLVRGAEEGREFLETEYSIHRWYRALDGSLSLYASIYVPRWGIPPWRKKTYRTELAGWRGFSGDLWEPALTKAKHELYDYPKDASRLIKGYRY